MERNLSWPAVSHICSWRTSDLQRATVYPDCSQACIATYIKHHLILTYLDLLPFDFHRFDHKIYSNGSPLSRWEKALKRKYMYLMMQLIDKYNIIRIILWVYTDLSKAPDKTRLSNSSISYQNYFEQVVIIFHAHPKL